MAKRVLVVDDELPILRLLEITLSRAGYDVVTASDGQQALHRMQDEVPDVVVLDIAMPRMNGYEMLEHMLADERLCATPVVVVTALEIEPQERRSTGVSAHVTKPIEVRELLVLLEQVTEGTHVSNSGTSMRASAV
jgi:CheY-like chemotaxis protein